MIVKRLEKYAFLIGLLLVLVGAPVGVYGFNVQMVIVEYPFACMFLFGCCLMFAYSRL